MTNSDNENEIQELENLKEIIENVGAEKKQRATRPPPLTAEMLLEENGLKYIAEKGPLIKYKGKGFEAEDLSKFVQFYKTWAHQIAPKLTFEAFIDKVELSPLSEEIGMTRSMKHYWNAATGRSNPEVAAGNLVGEENEGFLEDGREILVDDVSVDRILTNPSKPHIVLTNAEFGFDDDEDEQEIYQRMDLLEETVAAPRKKARIQIEEDDGDQLLPQAILESKHVIQDLALRSETGEIQEKLGDQFEFEDDDDEEFQF